MSDPLRDEVGRLSVEIRKIVSFWNRDVEWKTSVERQLAAIRAELDERKRWEDRTPLPKNGNETRAIRAKVQGDRLRLWGVIVLAVFTFMGTCVSVYAAVKVAQISAEAKERRSQ